VTPRPEMTRLALAAAVGNLQSTHAATAALLLAAAQRLSHQGWERISAAQQANEWDMDGHAAKAKELLDKVNEELKMAAEAANKNHK
jgi:hypothetical protein